MKTNIAIIITIIIMTLALTIWVPSLLHPKRNAVVAPVDTTLNLDNSIAPDFEITDINGTHISLSKFKGKTIILNFWASWCVPCVKEYPQMINLAKTLNGDLVIIALSVDANLKDINEFTKRYGTPPDNFYIAHDPLRKITQDLYGTIQLPESFIIDKDLKMRKKIIGASIEWDGADFTNILNDIYF
jgi:cytochrome c biogenesis protein CcmG/thiol:disulfide interchange protein DsbE